jgi:sialic acid synthase SpsE
MIDWRNKTDNGLLALGSSKKELSKSELNNRIIARRKPILSKEIKKGNILTKSEIYYSRPECTENGIIDIDELEFFIGMPFTMDVAPNQVLKRKFFL